MEKGKLFLQENNEFIKECTQQEYLELAIATPGQYSFQLYSKPYHTIQDLNNFANSIANMPIKHTKAKAKRHIWIVVKILGAISAIVTIVAFIIQILKK